MKKFVLVVLLFLLFLTPVSANALCNEPGGLVPCGKNVDATGKITCPCEIGHFFIMLAAVYNFIVYNIATPLAVIALTIGAIFMMVSAGNPNLFNTGKQILWAAIIGLALVWCSWLIINFILTTLGFTGNWANPF